MLGELGDSRGPARVLVFIPSYGDLAKVPTLVAQVEALGPAYRALVVDDGSPEPLSGVLSRGRHLLVRFPANFGLGVSTNVAFSHALQHGYRALVRIDADAQHSVEDVPRLVAGLDQMGVDLVVGSRLNQPKDWSTATATRRMVKWYLSSMAAMLTRGAAPKDVNSGFFAVSARGMRTLNATSFERFPEPELFISACRAGLSVREIPVQQRDREDGRTTLGVLAASALLFRFNVFALLQVFGRRRP